MARIAIVGDGPGGLSAALFLAKNGHRAIKEFELRSPRWDENPAVVLGMVRNYLLIEAGPSIHEKKAADARAELIGDALASEQLLHGLKPPRDGRDAAKHDARGAAGLAIHLEHHGHAH